MSMSARCERTDDARELRLSLLTELRRAVPFSWFAWLLTDPSTEVGVAPIADCPCLPDLPRLIRLKYATEVNRWTRLPGPVARLHAATDGRLDRSLLWRRLLVDHGVTDVASIVFRDRFGCWGFLELWRGDGAYTDDQTRFLVEQVDDVTRALRRCAPPADRPRPGPIVLVLSDQLEVRAQTPETERYLRALVPPEGDGPPVPASAYNVAAQLLAVEAGVDDHPPWARVHLDGGEWLTVRAARMGEDIAVTIERATTAERFDLFRRAAGLTDREAQLVDLLATGADTRAVASQMCISEHTVQDHLKAIFAKTGAPSRRALLARVVAA